MTSLDSDITLATCNRCGAYVFVATANGCKYAADPSPLDQNGVVAALVARKTTFTQLDQGGRPWRLQPRTASSVWPPAGGRKVLGEHGCGAMGQDVQNVQIVNPRLPDATSTASQTVASDGVRPPSDVWRCNACHCLINPKTELFVGIEHGTYRWARHDRDCHPQPATSR